MKKIIGWLLICSVFLACKKEQVYEVTPTSTDYVQLKLDQVINDSTIVLKWAKFTGLNFKTYRLLRKATYLKEGQFTTFTETVDESREIDHLSFTENNMPYARDITYSLAVIVYNPGNGLDTLRSGGMVQYQRPNSLTAGYPVDVLINKQQKWLYVIEEKMITLVDYSSGRPITSKEFPATIGNCSLGDFNGSNELYVPLYDGTVQVLNGANLQGKEKIYVSGLDIGSVAAFNGKLYVSSSDLTGSSNGECIKIYDRATKNLLGLAGYGSKTRLLLLEGTSFEMVDLSISIWTKRLNYHKFSANGTPVFRTQNYQDEYYYVDPVIMRSFPDGSKFITSTRGSVFDKSLSFQGYLKDSGGYSDFAFNSDGSTIYAANSYEKKIDAISYPALAIIKRYPTIGNPYKIFRDGNTLVCLSRSNSYMFIEKITL